jgi:hypothetical protein
MQIMIKHLMAIITCPLIVLYASIRSPRILRSNSLYIKYYAYLITYWTCHLLNLYNNCDITFLTMFIPTHPANFPCGRKPEYPEKTHDFRQSVDKRFSHACSDNCTTEAPIGSVKDYPYFEALRKTV